MAERGDYLLVGALDFGTTYSSYAFSFKTSPEHIITNSNWGEALGFKSHKTPTSILTDSKGKFLDMGYEAEQKYNEQTEEERSHDKKELYRHFKMILHKSKEVSLNTVITSLDGTKTPAIDIFGYAINYMREHLIKAIKDHTGSEPKPSSIFWVITVPAIWSEPSKKFMKEAAKRGGCITKANAKNIILALEPEAASLCCRRLNVAGYKRKTGIEFPVGTKYVVLDCGGGTIDVTVHRVVKKKKVEEILPASGGPWGGLSVDKNFDNLLVDIFGANIVNKYKQSNPQGWMSFMTTFETVKKPFTGDESSRISVQIPWTFGEFLKSSGQKPMDCLIREYANPNVSFSNGSLLITGKFAKGFFTASIDSIVAHLSKVLKDPKLKHCRYIFMVGGYSESRLLQDAIKETFERNGTKVLIPMEAQLAVIKGAVLFGHFPTEITSRIARKTYGYGLGKPFNPKVHDTNKMYVDDDGTPRCKDIFIPIVTIGESVSVGHEISYTFIPYGKSDTKSGTRIHMLDGLPNKPVQYLGDGTEVVGQVVIEHPPCSNRKQNTMKTIFTFGGTEIHVRVIHLATGKEFIASIDFLSDAGK